MQDYRKDSAGNEAGASVPAGSADPIVPIDFSPPDPRKKRSALKLRWPHLLIVGFLLMAGASGWFILTARSVYVQVTPITASVEIQDGFSLQLGERHLMLPGEYPILLRNEGYHDEQITLVVGEAQAQNHPFSLRELPGIVSFEATGVSGGLSGALVALNGAELGRIPLRDIELEPGEYELTITADRYFPYTEMITVPGRAAVTQFSAQMQQAWGEVSLSTEPAGAEILVNGQLLGTTPYNAEILQGQHEVTLKLAGHKAWQDRLEVVAGETLALPSVVLERADGLVFIRSQPSGANVTINGQFRGQTPIEVALPPGRTHEITLFRSGFDAASRSIQTRPDQEQDITVSLIPITSVVRVVAEPAEAELYVDGEFKGRANQTLELLAASQIIEVRLDGYVPYTGSFTSRPGLEQELRVSLKSLEDARVEAIRPVITTAAGQSLTLLYPGQFTMGASRREPGRRANEDLREVRLERAFYLSPHEVSNAQYRRFKAGHSSGVLEGRTLDLDNQPVVQVGWQDAALYCNWLSQQEGLPLFYNVEGGQVVGFNPDATGYRLPSEAEWEWAARTDGNGNVLRYPWGDQLPPPPAAGNFADVSVSNFMGQYIPGYDDTFMGTAPVGQFAVNSRGMYDMAGNVSEWVHDYYGTLISLGTAVEVDPLGPTSGAYHTIKGSSWAHSSITELRLSFRDFADTARNDLGFRIARYLEE
ncbi:MAG: PEGA domain-containing protein [Gammaproteobacteria bacterium]|nr:PEGA domain-containing protein [Gammaproteobacteria bacterium]MDP2139530.1 PEGA domain-containing protein [Gammaproteobacteria bacterium]MDP2346503.1 PEGA domain-containing protein [Gammaproteobacteria bacterium]